MKVLLINGSPHANGCTAAALAELCGTLELCGMETEVYHIPSITRGPRGSFAHFWIACFMRAGRILRESPRHALFPAAAAGQALRLIGSISILRSTPCP